MPVIGLIFGKKNLISGVNNMQTIRDLAIFITAGILIGVVISAMLLLGNNLAQQFFG